MIGIVSDPIFMGHDTGGYHPESPLRIQSIHTLFDGGGSDFILVEPQKAVVEDILQIHEKRYVQHIQQSCTLGRLVDLDPDTICSTGSYDVSLLAAGSLIKLTDMALRSEITGGLAFVRPPGHHATSDQAMGFCIFNNVAIAAKWANINHGIKKILIVDFDVHHGNGTQECFYNDDSVLYFSTHQYPFYPGTGKLSEIGKLAGEGFTVNCPLSSRKNDAQYVSIYQHIMAPIVEVFKPELILVSAGFDVHAMDPIGGMNISSDGFGAIAGIIQEAARKINTPVVYTLEGGYNREAMRDSIYRMLDVITHKMYSAVEPVMWPELDTIMETHRHNWPL